MPFDTPDLAVGLPTDTPAERANRRLVASWLFTLCFMTLVMVALGGATRLTGSGLSIMEWAPITGVLPPMSDAEWNRLFSLYQKIPQYRLEHEGFGLAGFKQIFWLEWVHRLWGRLIGLAFLVPFVWLAATKRIPRTLWPKLGGIFLLGGLQGGVGWFMVASGFFPNTTSVSPYRLVIHLLLAIAVYAAMFWTGLTILHPAEIRLVSPRARLLRRLGFATLGSIILTIIAGGLTAGLHAGLDYNTFPLMGGRLWPADYARLEPFWRNLTENIAAVQFDHRLIATVTLALGLLTSAIGFTTPLPQRARRALLALGLAVLGQYVLGVTTLLLVVPIPVAVAHQVGAMIVLTAAMAVVHALRGARPQDAPARKLRRGLV